MQYPNCVTYVHAWVTHDTTLLQRGRLTLNPLLESVPYDYLHLTRTFKLEDEALKIKDKTLTMAKNKLMNISSF